MDYTIRLAREDDIPHFAAIERSAASIFLTAPGLEWIAADETLSPIFLSSLCAEQSLWIAAISSPPSSNLDSSHSTTDLAKRDDLPIGFIVAYQMDDTDSFYIHEISVSVEYQRQGVGRRLIEAVEERARKDGYRRLMLTTYRDLEWNGGLYRKSGFVESEDRRVLRRAEDRMGEDARAGHDVEKRCVMVRTL